MNEALAFILGGVVAIIAIAYRWRVPGEPVMMTIVRPFNGGGPRPKK